ncbi:2-oxoglutarate dehydrogenase E1 component, partial [Klebsiella pneumoniae]
ASVLGFEYGYNVFAPETFVIWEAQYGDFANAAQVIIDQFVAAGRAKWAQRSSLVMLLPHGYEGQGPEHSSARMERFLQLSGENNWTIANLTSAAQYFHILRRQAKIAGRDEARPLIIMTPKSLIRNPYTASKGNELSEGRFQFLLEQPGLGRKPDRVERLIFCTGKVGVDLAAAIETGQFDGDALDWLHIVRVEQLYPFPEEELKDVISRYGRVKEMVWVQEEPQNMGAWTYMEPRLRALTDGRVPVRFIGRPERSSPAEGLPDVHN